MSTQTSRAEVGGERNNNKHKSAVHLPPLPPPLFLEPPPSPSVSEKLRVPPPANKAIRDGKDADMAAFERHSEQKRKRRGRESGIGRGLTEGLEGEEGGEVSVVVVSQKCKPTLC